MTREEEIKNFAQELGQKYFPDCQNIWARSNIEATCVTSACIEMAKWMDEHSFEEGAKWADKTMVEKACEWLEQHQESYDMYDAWSGDYVNFKSLIIDFRKSMEEYL